MNTTSIGAQIEGSDEIEIVDLEERDQARLPVGVKGYSACFPVVSDE
jgi:hypothetical protein